VVEPVLRLEALNKHFGGLTVTSNVTFEVAAGELHAVIGPNGAGKTTLINQISGLIAPDSGRILFAGRDVTALSVPARAALGLARSFQITSILPEFSVLENVALAVQARIGTSFRFIGRASAEVTLNTAAMAALDEVGLAARADVLAGHLSHGEKRALELAMALAMEPKLLLLDEPMAGAGREESKRLIAVLSRLKGRFPMLLVEHDMTAVFALADRISVLIYGQILTTGTPDAVRADPQVIAAYLGEEME
jgi:branched-chain amino acid transport system ATP-binding protein